MAVIAVYLGEPCEDKINNMSFNFFNDVLKFLGKRINYEAVANLYGNSFAKDAGKAVQDANPLYKAPKVGRGMMTMIDQIAIIDNKKPIKHEDEFVAALFDEESIMKDKEESE